MGRYYLGIDQGTTLTTAVIIDRSFRVAAKASCPHTNQYPQPGWVEQDPCEIYDNVLKAVDNAMKKIPGMQASDLCAFGIDHQGETCCIWDKETGQPVYPAIVWQDRRTADAAEQLKDKAGSRISSLTGLTPDAYYSATKLAWIMDHVPDARAKVKEGRFLIGTLNTYIFWRLSGGTVYKTDPASASCMMLMDLAKTRWEETLVEELLGIPASCLPKICDTASDYGFTEPSEFFGARVKLAGSTTDSSAAMIGGGCFGAGILKTSYGTGNFMSLQLGDQPVISEKGVVTDCIWREGQTAGYRFRGACYVAGAAVEWLKNGLRIIDDPKETSDIALSVQDSNGVYFVPAFSGLATPYWDPYSRGALFGITGGTDRAHIVRAVLEAIAYQVTDCYLSLRQEIDYDCTVMRADGGMVDNAFLMQLQADMLGMPVEVPVEKESAAFGAACIAAYADGALEQIGDVHSYVKIKELYHPSMTDGERAERLHNWRKAVSRSLGWISPEQ